MSLNPKSPPTRYPSRAVAEKEIKARGCRLGWEMSVVEVAPPMFSHYLTMYGISEMGFYIFDNRNNKIVD